MLNRAVRAASVFTGLLVGFAASVGTEPPIAKVNVAQCFSGPLLIARDHPACYEAMARDPWSPTVAPFAFRPLTPLIVHLLPADPSSSFRLVTIVFLAAAGAVLFDLLFDEIGPGGAAIGVALFVLGGPAPSILSDPSRVDALMSLVGIGVVASVRRNRLAAASAVIALGVLNHELALLFLPLLLAGSWREPRWALVWCLPPLAVYAILHYTSLWYGHLIPNMPFLSVANVRFAVGYRIRADGNVVRALYTAVVAAGGAIVPLAIIGFRRADPGWQRFCVFLLGPIAMLALGADWSRILALCWVVVVPLAAFVVAPVPRKAPMRESAPASC